MWQIIINGPGYFDTAYDLPEGVTSLGRADENDIVLSGDLVSRRHARFHVKGDQLAVEDLGSRNGSRVNGDALSGMRDLAPGDTVTVGENTMAIRQPAAAEGAQTQLHVSTGGGVRFGGGEIGAVLLARDVRESTLLKILDNVTPFEPEPGPGPSPESPSLAQAAPIAYESLLLLYAAAERLATARTLSEFLDPVMDRVLARVNATTAVVLLKQAAGGFAAAAVRHRGRLAQGEVPISDAIVEEALTRGSALAVADVRDDRRFAQRESVVMYGVDQVLCIPFGREGQHNGVLYLNKSGSAAGELSELLDLCAAVANLIAIGVDRLQAAPAAQAPSAAGGGGPGGGPAPSTDRVRAALERALPPPLVERRMKDLGRGPRRPLEERMATVLFADVSGFTRLIQLVAPDRVALLLGEFYQRMTGIVFSFEGTVEKFMGDAVMAVFGAPYVRGDDALRAVRAALAMRADWDKTLLRFPELERRRLRIGVNTGRVLAGMVGSEARLDYTVLGETVNVASWLTASAEAGQVLISGKTLASVGARFDVVPLGERALRARVEKVPVFEVVDEDPGHNTAPGG